MILNIYKPVGWTSADVVRKVKKITQEKKVGHGGTLEDSEVFQIRMNKILICGPLFMCIKFYDHCDQVFPGC